MYLPTSDDTTFQSHSMSKLRVAVSLNIAGCIEHRRPKEIMESVGRVYRQIIRMHFFDREIVLSLSLCQSCWKGADAEMQAGPSWRTCH